MRHFQQQITVALGHDDAVFEPKRVEDVAVLGEAQVIKGRRFGNFVLAASPTELPLDWMPRLLAGGPHPAQLVHGAALRDWIAGAAVVTDATAVASPPPGRGVFQIPPKR